MSTIPFDEIAAGTSVRMCMIGNVQCLSIRDILMHISGLNRKRATEKWGLIPPEVKQEVAELVHLFQFPGQGNKPEPVITFKGALKLVMMVSGTKAAVYRAAMVKILTRYYAGDGTLLDEVEANAQSTAPIAQMARASLVADEAPVQNEVTLPHKRRLEELELCKLEADIKDRQIGYLMKCSGCYQDMCKDTVMDERAKLIFKDLYLNMAMLQGGPSMITNGDPLPSKPISLSLVAGEMGLKLPTNELISLGVELKRRYLAAHGKAPSKHDQLCDGRVTKVNSYSESDRPLVEEVLRWHMANKITT